MSNHWDFWDKIFCINLDYRTDRWKECLVEFDKVGLIEKVIRFPAIAHEHGGLGCYLSHIKLMKEMLKTDFKRVLILEDDIQFIDDGIINIPATIEDLGRREWDLFFFGIRTNGPIYKVNEHLAIPVNGGCTHAIGYTPESLKLCMEDWANSVENANKGHFVPIDSRGPFTYIRALESFCPYKIACVQRSSPSNLCGFQKDGKGSTGYIPSDKPIDFSRDNVNEYRTGMIEGGLLAKVYADNTTYIMQFFKNYSICDNHEDKQPWELEGDTLRVRIYMWQDKDIVMTRTASNEFTGEERKVKFYGELESLT